MQLLTVIPARVGARRLPNKPLRLLAGEPLIRAVTRNVLAMGLEGELVVATDDPRVADAVLPLGVAAVLTDPGHASGTERVREVANLPAYRSCDPILNLQGDEPFLTAGAARAALARVAAGEDVGTVAQPLTPEAARDPHRVKVVVDGRGRALGFHRTPVGWACNRRDAIFQHIGIYAFTRRALERWMTAPPVPAEREQSLEQLRPLAHGLTIGVAVLAEPVPHGIDTEADLRSAEARL